MEYGDDLHQLLTNYLRRIKSTVYLHQTYKKEMMFHLIKQVQTFEWKVLLTQRQVIYFFLI